MSISQSFENHLKNILDKQLESSTREAMAYSLLNPGKRIRPRLLWSICNSYGADMQEALNAGALIEMLHCYSLVHDDLPALDNDTLRRGKSTCHIQFNEATAILAGDGLLTLAFELIGELKPEHAAQTVTLIAKAGGISGMIAGQDYDINNRATDWPSYQLMAELKTGRLFAASLALGAIIGNQTDLVSELENIGRQLGLAFQIQDDLLEVTKSESLNKSLSDQANNKLTAVSLLGEKAAKEAYRNTYHNIQNALGKLPRKFPALLELLDELLERQN